MEEPSVSSIEPPEPPSSNSKTAMHNLALFGYSVLEKSAIVSALAKAGYQYSFKITAQVLHN